jgi:hypothetical protein
VFNPIPPESIQPPPEPADEPKGDDPDEVQDNAEPEMEMPQWVRPPRWPALVRWSRICRVLAILSVIYFGWGAASNVYQLLQRDSQFPLFMQQPVAPSTYLYYALLNVVLAIASCISLLGFAELLHLLMSIEAASREQRDRSPRSGDPDAR